MSNYYHEEEAFYHFTLMDFVSLVEDHGDRIWADLEKHSPAIYEAFCAYRANKDVEEFLSNKKRDEDYYND